MSDLVTASCNLEAPTPPRTPDSSSSKSPELSHSHLTPSIERAKDHRARSISFGGISKRLPSHRGLRQTATEAAARKKSNSQDDFEYVVKPSGAGPRGKRTKTAPSTTPASFSDRSLSSSKLSLQDKPNSTSGSPEEGSQTASKSSLGSKSSSLFRLRSSSWKSSIMRGSSQSVGKRRLRNISALKKADVQMPKPYSPHFDMFASSRHTANAIYQIGQDTANKWAVALYDFVGDRPGEISLEAGERVFMLREKTRIGWAFGRTPRGTCGRFPRSYVAFESSLDKRKARNG